MKRNNIVYFTIAILAVASGIWLYESNREFKAMLLSCPEYHYEVGFGPGATETSFESCSGVIVIEEVNTYRPRYFEVKNVLGGSLLGEIDNDRQYVFQDGYLYFFQSIREPHYIKIQTMDGRISRYDDLSKVSNQEKYIFSKLEGMTNGSLGFRIDNIIAKFFDSSDVEHPIRNK